MSAEVEGRLRETLDALADHVELSPRAYRRTQASWRRRERRRRLLLILLVTLAIGGADAAGIWALNHGPTHAPIVFNGPAPVAP